jgi:hypothetical protein
MSRPLPRISRDLVKWQRKPDTRVKRGHLAFVRALGICLCCGRVGPVEAMHVRSGTDGGMGLKPSDRFTVPGCHDCHVRSHQVGEQTFWGALGIDPLDCACRLWTVTGDEEQGRRAIERARQAIRLHQTSVQDGERL